MNNSSYPLITIVVPTFNEERRIELCLSSIFGQDYPKSKLEVIVIDDSSTDRTLEIASRYPVKVMHHKSSDAEVGKRIAFRVAKGEFFTYIDADIHLRGVDWIKKMVKPLMEDKTIIASFTKFYSDQHSSKIEQFLNLDPLQRDPVLQFFSPDFKNLISEKHSDYVVCKYGVGKIPPAGLCVHRYNRIKDFVQGRRFHELNLIADLVLSEENRFAYVENAGLFHHHAKDLKDLLIKRRRNVMRVYLGEERERRFKWFDLSTPGGVMKLIIWIIGANLFIPSCFSALYKMFKFRTFVALYEPVISFLITDIFLFSFISDIRGLRLLFNKRYM